MTDALPTSEIDFEEPPPIARRSEHLPLLLALKAIPGRSARVQKDKRLTDKEAQSLANAVKGAAAKIGDGYSVVTRFIPAADCHGVWVTYEPVEGDEPPVPTPEARAEAKETIADAMQRPIPAESTEITGDGTGQALPLADDTDWELPERSGARS